MGKTNESSDITFYFKVDMMCNVAYIEKEGVIYDDISKVYFYGFGGGGDGGVGVIEFLVKSMKHRKGDIATTG